MIDNSDHLRALDPFFRVIEQPLEELLTVDISSTCSPRGQLSDALMVSRTFIKSDFRFIKSDFRFAAELTPEDENYECHVKRHGSLDPIAVSMTCRGCALNTMGATSFSVYNTLVADQLTYVFEASIRWRPRKDGSTVYAVLDNGGVVLH